MRMTTKLARRSTAIALAGTLALAGAACSDDDTTVDPVEDVDGDDDVVVEDEDPDVVVEDEDADAESTEDADAEMDAEVDATETPTEG